MSTVIIETKPVGAGIIESGSNTNGAWIKYGDGTMECWGSWLSTTGAAGGQLNWYGTTSGMTYYRALTVTFPKSFLTGTTPKVVSSSATVASLETLSSSGFVNSIRYNVDPVGLDVCWHAIGRWKA